MDLRVASKTLESEDTCCYELVDPGGALLPAFSAGSHVLVQIREGLVRSYSLYGSPLDRRRYCIAVLRDPTSRGGSIAMHDQVQVGQMLRTSEPRNHFPLQQDATYSLLLAGGIGITPLLCMAEHLGETRSPFTLHYCNRNRARSAFLQRLAEPGLAAHVHLHFDDGPDAQRLQIARELKACPAGSHLYVCGPKGFIDHIVAEARAQGWPASAIHFELFAGNAVSHASDGSFEVQLARSGKLVTVAKNKTVVEALADAGIVVDTSCEQGVCGVCLTRVLEGVPDHKDMFLTDKEQAQNNQFTPCCSRAKTARLVLDI
jgi:vanillate O-demethylase ferredoxin subunit